MNNAIGAAVMALVPGRLIMKATVDKELCIGCGLCAQICDAVFEMDDDVAQVKVETVPADAEASCKEAAESCPVDAIAVTE